MGKEKKEHIKIGKNPIIAIIFITVIVAIISSILSLLGLEGQKTVIVNNTLETSLITIRNIFTVDGIKFILGNSITNFQIVEALGLLVVSLITISFMDYSGLIKPIAKPLKKVKPFVLTFIILIISALLSFVGDYSYLIMMPFVALVYKELGKNPVAGIITVFLGLTLGYGTGFIFNNNDYLLGRLTEQAAKIDVDKNYKYHLISNLYIMISSIIILIFVLTYCIEKKIAPKLSKIKKEEIEIIEPQEINKNAIIFSGLVFTILVIILIYCLIPGLPASGLLLNNEGQTYLSSLNSPNASFGEGLPYIIMFIMMLTSYIYGKISKNITKENDYSTSLSKNLYGIGYVLTLIFLVSQLMAIINWTNIGEVFAVNLITFMAGLQFSGIPLLIVLFIITILISIMIPSTITKWMLMSPLIVPLFMRSNITPDFTQFIFKIADGIGKSVTPLYIYFIIMLGFIQDYEKNKKVTLFGTYKLILPTILIIAGLLMLIIVGWFVIGLPLGPNTYPAL